jgi:hypothetical protein
MGPHRPLSIHPAPSDLPGVRCSTPKAKLPSRRLPPPGKLDRVLVIYENRNALDAASLPMHSSPGWRNH